MFIKQKKFYLIILFILIGGFGFKFKNIKADENCNNIKIIAPQQCEVLTEGELYEIRWEYSGPDPDKEVVIALFRDDFYNGEIAYVPIGSKSFLWMVSADNPNFAYGSIFKDVFYPLKYEIKIGNSSSGWFRIKEAEINLEGKKIYENKKYGFNFEIPLKLRQIGYRIIEDPHNFIMFQAKPINGIGTYSTMLHIVIRSQDYCNNEGKEECNIIKNGEEEFLYFLAENKNYFIFYSDAGPCGGETWDKYGWFSKDVEEAIDEMINSFKFV